VNQKGDLRARVTSPRVLSCIVALIVTPLVFRSWALLSLSGAKGERLASLQWESSNHLGASGDGNLITLDSGGLLLLRLDASPPPDWFVSRTSDLDWECSWCSTAMESKSGIAQFGWPPISPTNDVRVIWTIERSIDEAEGGHTSKPPEVVDGSDVWIFRILFRPSRLRCESSYVRELRGARQLRHADTGSLRVLLGTRQIGFSGSSAEIAVLTDVRNQLNVVVFMERYDGDDATREDLRSLLLRMTTSVDLPEISE